MYILLLFTKKPQGEVFNKYCTVLSKLFFFLSFLFVLYRTTMTLVCVLSSLFSLWLHSEGGLLGKQLLSATLNKNRESLDSKAMMNEAPLNPRGKNTLYVITYHWRRGYHCGGQDFKTWFSWRQPIKINSKSVFRKKCSLMFRSIIEL